MPKARVKFVSCDVDARGNRRIIGASRDSRRCASGRSGSRGNSGIADLDLMDGKQLADVARRSEPVTAAAPDTFLGLYRPDLHALAGVSEAQQADQYIAAGSTIRLGRSTAPIPSPSWIRCTSGHCVMPGRIDRNSANETVKALRQVVSIDLASKRTSSRATLRKLVPVDSSKNNPDGHHTWTVEEVETFRALFDPIGSKPRLALELGAVADRSSEKRRDQDGPQHVRDGWLTVKETKGRELDAEGNRHPASAGASADHRREQRDRSRIPGQRRMARSYTNGSFGTNSRQWCDAAGLEHCFAHGLRKAGASIAAEHGATEFQRCRSSAGAPASRRRNMSRRHPGRRRRAWRCSSCSRHRIRSSTTTGGLSRFRAPSSSGWDNDGKKVKLIKAGRTIAVPRAGIEPATP